MNIVFTICSNNYLAQAKTLGDSVKEWCKGYKFVIGLVDHFSDQIDYKFFDGFEILPIDQLQIDCLDEMASKYNITELNTAVKPYIFNFLFSREPDVDKIIYLDPDIKIYSDIHALESAFTNSDIVVTPHFTTPIYDKFNLGETDILNSGIYNLGFLGVKRSKTASVFLDWWMIKLKDYCYVDFCRGMFTDQIWINFVPLYYDNVYIFRHKGYNMAYWNLHERVLSYKEDKYFVNDSQELVFFHFSGYGFKNPLHISKYQNRFDFTKRTDLVQIFQSYHEEVMSNRFNEFSSIPCSYIKPAPKTIEQGSVVRRLGRKTFRFLKKHIK